VTPEFSCKWAFTEPQQGQFTFGECDAVVQFAQQSQQVFRGHNLVWGEFNPQWISNLRYNVGGAGDCIVCCILGLV
jgi:endo-1,4-beta-xylanase